MNIIRIFSLLSILFGILIILMPQILAYLVAIFLILLGLSGLGISSGPKSYLKVIKW